MKRYMQCFQKWCNQVWSVQDFDDKHRKTVICPTCGSPNDTKGAFERGAQLTPVAVK